ncbi:MAG: arabinose operon transcriptional regulator AraC [Halioglobus sp.]
MNLGETARYLYSTIDGEPMDDTPSSEVSRFLDRQPPLAPKVASEQASVLQTLLEQPRIPEIANRWRPHFLPGAPLSQKQATLFIQQVLGAFESVDSLMDYRATGGYSESNEGQWNDYSVYRPGHKRGWGVHLTTAGAGRYNCLRRTLEVGEGDLILMSPEAFYDYGRSTSVSNWGVHWAIFQADSRVVDLLNWPEVGAGVHHLRCPAAEQMEKFTDLFQEISRLSNQPDAGAVRLRHNLLEEILLRCQEFIPPEQRGGVDRRVQLAIDYIESHYTGEVTVEDVAAAASLSVSSLARLFKQHTGLTVLGWRDERRMALACEKVTHSRLRIAEIADLVGYQDQLYFSRVFRRHMGQPPSEYRRQFLST